MSTPSDVTVPADLLGTLRTALLLARTDVGDGLREWGQHDCLDCGVDDEPCDNHAGDQDVVDDIDALLGLLPAENPDPDGQQPVRATVALTVTIETENAMPTGVTGQADVEPGTARWLVASLLDIPAPAGRLTSIDVTEDTTTSADPTAALPFAEYVRDLLALSDELDSATDHIDWIKGDLFSRAKAIWGPRRVTADATVEVELAADTAARLTGNDFLAAAAADLDGTVTVGIRRIELH